MKRWLKFIFIILFSTSMYLAYTDTISTVITTNGVPKTMTYDIHYKQVIMRVNLEEERKVPNTDNSYTLGKCTVQIPDGWHFVDWLKIDENTIWIVIEENNV